MSSVERAVSPRGRRSRLRQLTFGDRVWLKFAIGIPFFFHIMLVWMPAMMTAYLSFTEWDNLAPVFKQRIGLHNFWKAPSLLVPVWVGLRNYKQIFTIFDPKLFPALFNNLILIIWLGLCSAIGMLFAYLLDKNVKGGRFYQSVFYMPVVLSIAVVGFIWKAVMFQTDRGLLNKVIPGQGIDFLGNNSPVFTMRFDKVFGFVIGVVFAFIAWRLAGRKLHGSQPLLVALATGILVGGGAGHFIHDLSFPLQLTKNFSALLVAMAWRHIGYVMVLYLAGLKGVDPTLREAAAIDGANEPTSFRHVVFPTLRPINAVVAVITVIEALRAYDIIAALGTQRGTEVMGTLVTGSLTGEGGGRVGIGSAYGMVLFVLCIGFIIYYVINNFRDQG